MDRLLDHWAATEANWDGTSARLQWHAPLGGEPVLTALADRLRAILARGYLVPVEPQWLHLTLHDVGTWRKSDHDELERLVDTVRAFCSGLAPLRLRLGLPRVARTAVVLEALHASPISRLRDVLHAADVELRGPDATPLPTGPASAPHVSLAYARRNVSTNGLTEELQAAAGESRFELAIPRIELLLLERDYTWTSVAHVDLGG
jgi:2'-5' RNA ligase